MSKQLRAYEIRSGMTIKVPLLCIESPQGLRLPRDKNSDWLEIIGIRPPRTRRNFVQCFVFDTSNEDDEDTSYPCVLLRTMEKISRRWTQERTLRLNPDEIVDVL